MSPTVPPIAPVVAAMLLWCHVLFFEVKLDNIDQFYVLHEDVELCMLTE